MSSSYPNTVLVVDDEQVVLNVVVAILKRRGLPVKSAATAEEALELMKREGFGCLLTDKNLPGMDGLELLREARKLQPYCACLVMTGYSSTQSAVDALRMGALDYLEKPFTDMDLVGQKVERAIEIARTQAERESLLHRIQSFKSELKTRDETLNKQQTEIDLFNQILEGRVAQATEDLRKRAVLLEQSLSSNEGVEEALSAQARSIVDYVRGVKFDDDEPIAVARGVLARIERKLDALISLTGAAKKS